MSKITYVNVILPLALRQEYTYAVPFDLVDILECGKRVLVQFGANKYYAALISKIHTEKPHDVEPKPIDSVIDDIPILDAHGLKLWHWMSAYYMCTTGEVMAAALPAGLKISSETVLVLHPEFEGSIEMFTNKERILAEALQNKEKLTWQEMQKIASKKNIHPEVKSLVSKGFALYLEELQSKYKPRTESFLAFHELYTDPQNLKLLFEELRRAKKQVDALLLFVYLLRGKTKVRKSEMIAAGTTAATLNVLVEKEILVESKEEVSRIQNSQIDTLKINTLTEIQKEALGTIQNAFEQSIPVLLEGITGSGKTHIYFELIKDALLRNEQVLYLIPEISLTVQLIKRLQAVFGNEVGVYHSKYNSAERVEIWYKVLRSEYKVILGARSAVFLPFVSLGLIIVDEEHDASYKQNDPSPRYQGRDTALILAGIHKCNIILGSATPSIESYYNASIQKLKLVMLNNRYAEAALPLVHITDMKTMQETKQVVSHYSFELVNKIRSALANKDQVILFQNRRGFSQYICCHVCGWIPKCHQCDVSLTYHKHATVLACHYCGSKKQMVSRCSACASDELKIKGFGTEKIEDELKELFPDARIDRLDWDAVKTKHGYTTVIERFEDRQTDILVGTQMVTKGLDFSGVSLVGVILADQLLFYPDFRATERAFQLLVQVSGRAGRDSKRGYVIIQTFQPQHPVFEFVKKHDFHAFYASEIYYRKNFNFPPFCRLIQIQLSHKEVSIINQAAAHFILLLKNTIHAAHINGPTVPPVSYVRSYYLRNILLKIEKTNNPKQIKLALYVCVTELQADKNFKGLHVRIDVDP